ncbi:hypothetical protein HNP85_000402 [Methanococcus maripaludis]|uniref:Uncharacterized protein n=1 Tax=Methanococcus maripaludis TaxID=39152 RepID=A0A8T4CJ78_METMI|nr:hypothetical protein [Methanococcus maripaludis]MBP2220348.1 hypothetical protein [Methanococcus maripaludis]
MFSSGYIDTLTQFNMPMGFTCIPTTLIHLYTHYKCTCGSITHLFLCICIPLTHIETLTHCTVSEYITYTAIRVSRYSFLRLLTYSTAVLVYRVFIICSRLIRLRLWVSSHILLFYHLSFISDRLILNR